MAEFEALDMGSDLDFEDCFQPPYTESSKAPD